MPWGGISFLVQRAFPGNSPELFSGGPGPEPPEIKAQAEKLTKNKVHLLISSNLHT
jgi:hypothetical protein